MDSQELLSIEEAAELTRTPVSTMRYWRHVGKGPHSFRVGRRVRYRRTDVEHWLSEQVTGKAPLPAA